MGDDNGLYQTKQVRVAPSVQSNQVCCALRAKEICKWVGNNGLGGQTDAYRPVRKRKRATGKHRHVDYEPPQAVFARGGRRTLR